MKYIFNREKFMLYEAKLRDVLLDPQIDRIKHVWGEKYLDLEEIEATDKIKQGKWKLSDEDKGDVINRFFDFNYNWVKEKLNSLPEKFNEVIADSVDIDADGLNLHQKNRLDKALRGSKLNMKSPKIKQLSCLYYPIFKILNANETKSDEMIIRESPGGRPIIDEKTKKIKKVKKEKGELVFSGNLGNINSFISSYNRAFPNDKVDESIFTDRNIQNISNMINDNPDIIEFDLFGGGDIYLLIEHKPKFIMNMSVSKFYKSCQEMYFGGGHGRQYMEQLLSNVFDPNSIPAFLVFDTPYYIDTESRSGSNLQMVSEVMPLCRKIIRSIEPFGSGDEYLGLRFDFTYPDRMATILKDMIEKYSGNINNSGLDKYYFAPDIDPEDLKGLQSPYMDNMRLEKGLTIGKNVKSLHLGIDINYKNIKIVNNNLEEVVIETTDVPLNFFNIGLNIKWVKFKYLFIKDINIFNNIKTNSISFDKCKLNNSFFEDLYNTFPNIERLNLTSIETDAVIYLSKFEKLKDLELLYAVNENNNLSEIISTLKLNKLTISGDLLKSDNNKEYIKKLKKEGVTIITKGLVI